MPVIYDIPVWFSFLLSFFFWFQMFLYCCIFKKTHKKKHRFYFLIPLLSDFSYFSTRQEKVERKRDNKKKCESKQYCAKVHLHLGTLQTKLYRFANKDYKTHLSVIQVFWTLLNRCEFLFHYNFYCNFPFCYDSWIGIHKLS